MPAHGCGGQAGGAGVGEEEAAGQRVLGQLLGRELVARGRDEQPVERRAPTKATLVVCGAGTSTTSIWSPAGE